MPRACPEPSRRGGKRPGAGAPAGNLNALKHGAHSSYIHALVQALAAHPTTREALIRLARRRRAQKREAARPPPPPLRPPGQDPPVAEGQSNGRGRRQYGNPPPRPEGLVQEGGE